MHYYLWSLPVRGLVDNELPFRSSPVELNFLVHIAKSSLRNAGLC